MAGTKPQQLNTPPSPVALADLDLTLAEVKQLWSFLGGSIMNVDIRHHLWRSWGFCPRHTWSHAIAECAYRHSLFSSAILYEDLTTRAANAVRRPALRANDVQRRLRPRDTCFTCDYIAFASGNLGNAARLKRVNRRERFNELLLEVEPVWTRRSCPMCLGGYGLVCRPHLLSSRQDPPVDLADGLADIAERLDVLVKSMTWRGPKAGNDHRSSWVEALGWFAGWQYAATAASTQASDPKTTGSG